MLAELKFPFGIHIPGTNIDSISTFSIMLMLAFLAASYLVPKELKRRGLDPEVADYSILLAVIGAIVGSKIGYVIEVWDQIWLNTDGFGDTLYHIIFYREGMGHKYPNDATGMWEALFSRGGLVFYGGFALTVILMASYIHWRKLHVWTYSDGFIPSLALGYGIGRMGCLVSGDGCFGYAAAADIPLFTMVYSEHGAMSSAGVNVWNTPLIEATISWALFAWMMLKGRYKNFKPGMLFAIFLIVNGTARFFVEFLRINDAMIPVLDHPTYNGQLLAHHNEIQGNPGAEYFNNWRWYGFTQSQVFGVLMVIIGTIWIIKGRLYAGGADQAAEQNREEKPAAAKKKAAKKSHSAAKPAKKAAKKKKSGG